MPGPLSNLTPEQIAALSPQQLAALAGAAGGNSRPASSDDGDDVDFNDGSDSAGRLNDCKVVATIRSCQLGESTREDLPEATLFTVTWTIDKVDDAGTEREPSEQDENPPRAPVVGETRRWSPAVSGKRNGRNRARVRAMIQSALGLVPNSRAANEMKDASGNAVNWDAEIKAACKERNPLEGRQVYISVERVVGKKSKKAGYYPNFSPVKK